ncbi:MAG: histidine phosphatase family protein [Gammaproteobacteria bacterium]|nr:histidine phosphatase family protein [Gammaproteobacteria bacterium]
MALCFVRHGQTDWNLQRRFQSRTDIALNETGRTQARQIRDEFLRRKLRFVSAYCSPLSRAQQTTQIILNGTDIVPVVEPSFTELDLGEYEGCLEQELRTRYGASYDQWREQGFLEPAPGGESVMDGVQRVHASMSTLRHDALKGDTLVVAHQGVIMSMKVVLSGREDIGSLRSFKQANDVIELWDAQQGTLIETLRVPASS